MATARRTFVSFSSAFGSWRSAKTLPELRVTCFPLPLVVMTCLVIFLSQFEPLGYQLNVFSWRFDSARGLLLKSVEHIDSIRKTNRIDRSICVAAIILH